MKSLDLITNKIETIKPKTEFKDLKEAEDYLIWKQEVPEPIRRVVEGVMLGKAEGEQFWTDLVHTNEFLCALRKSLIQKDFIGGVSKDVLVGNLLQPLSRVNTHDGFINLFEILADHSVSWEIRKRLYETQIKPAFEWIVEKDIDEAMEKARVELQKEGEKSGDNDRKESVDKNEERHEVPPSSDESISSMEAGGEKKEGKPKEYFTVNPYYGGYAKSHVYTRFDLNKLHFIPERGELLEIEKSDTETSGQVRSVEYDKTSVRVMYGLARGNEPLAIPLYYNFIIDQTSLKTNAPNGSVKFLKDKNGINYLFVDKPGIWNYSFVIGKSLVELQERVVLDRDKKQRGDKKHDRDTETTEGLGKLPNELIAKIKELRDQHVPSMKLAREMVKLIRANLTYSNNHDAWNQYASAKSDFFLEIWKNKEADCHVVNTLAYRTLVEAGIACRFVNGHYVKNKNEKGEAIMHSGSGHAWLEIWDNIGKKWLRLDATPKGDPTVDGQEQEKDLEDPKDKDEGDYGEDDEIMDIEKVKEQIKEIEGQANGKNRKNIVNLEEATFLSEAGCTEMQAREFLSALERVRQIQDEDGNFISEQLIGEWQKIVEERKIEKSEYRGPVRMDEGELLKDPVATVIDLKAKELNPTGFERMDVIQTVDYDFGGINVLFSFDLSGSMKDYDDISGRPKSDVQRDVALLFIDSLMQCAFLHRRESMETDLLPLKIMATVASNSGQVKLPLTDRWGPKEQWQFYSALNHLASGGTPTHETLEYIKRAIEEENKVLIESKVSDDKMPINYVIETSDGAPDDLADTLSKHDELMKIKNTVVRAYVIGGTDMNRPEYTKLDSFSVLAQTMAKDIIEQFRKLKPKIR